MSRTGAVLRAALAGAAAVVLTACSGGGGSNTNAASSGTTTSSSSAATTTSSAPPGAGSAFCAQAQSFVTQVEALAVDQNNPNLGQTLQQLAGQLQQIKPPAPIASDWQSATSAIAQVAQLYQGTNFSDPQQVQALQQKLAPLEQQLITSGQGIEQYLSTQCGISTPGTATTAPSS